MAANQLVLEHEAAQHTKIGVEKLKIRSVLTCESKRGCCAMCYGLSLATSRLVKIGEAVGIVAAQSIGEPGTQLTMRTFHVGGAASRAAVQSSVDAKSSGTVRYSPTLRYVSSAKGEKVVISRSGEVLVTEENGRERERHKVPYGATMLADDGGDQGRCQAGQASFLK